MPKLVWIVIVVVSGMLIPVQAGLNAAFKKAADGDIYYVSADIESAIIGQFFSMVEIAKSFPKPRSYFGTKEVSDAYKNLAVYF